MATTTYLTDGGYVITSEPAGTNDLDVQKYFSSGTPVGPAFVYHAPITISSGEKVAALSNGGYTLNEAELTGAHFGGPVNNVFVFSPAGQELSSSARSGMS